jgi:hypothetical protein
MGARRHVIKQGDRVAFCAGRRPFSNGEFFLGGLTGTVMVAEPTLVCIRLHAHFVELDEWDNKVVWTPEDFEGGTLLEGVAALCEEAR